VAGSFLAQIERAREAAQNSAPADKPVEEMSADELAEAHRVALIRSTEAQRAVVAAAAGHLDDGHQGPATLAAKLAELQRGKRKHWR
jgi:predicted RNA-binding protein associated with RNAse of E/G family